MHTKNLRKLAIETNDGVMRGPALGAADEIDRLRADIERMTKERDEALAAEAEYRRKNHKLTDERDEARTQVAAAYKVAAKYLQSAADDWRSTNNELPAKKIEDEIPGVLGLTPADAKAALEAYGREKVEQALDAANAYMTIQYGIAALGHPVDRQRILADMEKLK